VLAAGLKISQDVSHYFTLATKANALEVTKLAKEYSCPVAVKGSNLDEVAELTGILNKAGINDIVIRFRSENGQQSFQDQIVIRGSALQKEIQTTGYPTITFPAK